MQRKQIAPHLWKAFNKPVLHALKLVWLGSFLGGFFSLRRIIFSKFYVADVDGSFLSQDATGDCTASGLASFDMLLDAIDTFDKNLVEFNINSKCL